MELRPQAGSCRAEGLTTPRQIRFLESRGFLHVWTWRFDDAKEMIDRIAANDWKMPYDIFRHTIYQIYYLEWRL